LSQDKEVVTQRTSACARNNRRRIAAKDCGVSAILFKESHNVYFTPFIYHAFGWLYYILHLRVVNADVGIDESKNPIG